MATLQQIEDGIRRLAAKNPRDPRIRTLGEERKRLLGQPLQTEGRAPVPLTPGDERPSTGDFYADMKTARTANPEPWKAKGVSDIDTSVPEDLINVFGEGYTWGTGNRLSGGKEAVAEGEAAKERLGGAALPVEIAGGLASPTIFARGPLMAYRGGKTALNALEGGAGSAADAWAKDQSWSDVGKAALQGAGLSGIVSKAVEPVSNWLQRADNKANQTYKTAAEQRAGYKKKYADVKAAGGVYQNADLRSLAAEVQNIKLVKGVDDRAIALRKRLLNDWRNKDIPPEDLDKLRRWVRIKMKSAQPNDARLGEEFVSAMDKFTDKTDVVKPSATGIGPPQKVPDVNAKLKSARKDVAGYERGRIVQKVANRAKRAADTGRMNPFSPSLESARVKGFGGLEQKIEEGRAGSQFPKVEKKAIEQLRKGTLRRNTGGYAEHLAFSGKLGKYLSLAGQLTHLAPGGSALGFPALAASSVAEGLHQFGQKATKTEIEDLLALTRDATGKGIKADPRKIEEARRKMAKILAATHRARPEEK